MNERQRETANWALTMFLLASIYVLAQRVATLEERTRFFHGNLTVEEAKEEQKDPLSKP